MNFYRYSEWSAAIRNHYWYLRYAWGFDLVKIRKWCRYIAAEKNAPIKKALSVSWSVFYVVIWSIREIEKWRNDSGMLIWRAFKKKLSFNLRLIFFAI